MTKNDTNKEDTEIDKDGIYWMKKKKEIERNPLLIIMKEYGKENKERKKQRKIVRAKETNWKKSDVFIKDDKGNYFVYKNK